MNRRHVRGFIAFNAFVMLLTYAGISYAYVEPVRPVLPNVTETDLTNPDLPHRKGLKEGIGWPFSTEDLGKITWHSAVSAGVSIDPNIYLSNQDEKYDIVFADAASVGIEIPIPPLGAIRIFSPAIISASCGWAAIFAPVRFRSSRAFPV